MEQCNIQKRDAPVLSVCTLTLDDTWRADNLSLITDIEENW